MKLTWKSCIYVVKILGLAGLILFILKFANYAWSHELDLFGLAPKATMWSWGSQGSIIYVKAKSMMSLLHYLFLFNYWITSNFIFCILKIPNDQQKLHGFACHVAVPFLFFRGCLGLDLVAMLLNYQAAN